MPAKRTSAVKNSGRFATTRWSLVRAVGVGAEAESRAALTELCNAYWYPLYAFVRHRGHDRTTAEDLLQGFFVELLEKQTFARADEGRGRLRTFLLACLKHFLSHQQDMQRTKKRGGGQRSLTLDFPSGDQRYRHEPAVSAEAERLFERAWAQDLVQRALRRLLASQPDATPPAVKSACLTMLVNPDAVAYAALAKETGKTEAALRQTLSRFRKKYREVLTEEISQTVAEPADVEEEIRQLFAAFSAG